MFSAHCPRHGHTVFVPTARIHSIESTDDEHVVRWHCSCGERTATRLPRRRSGAA